MADTTSSYSDFQWQLARNTDRIKRMATTSEIVKEHREAMKALRKKHKDPKEVRKFLIRAGILNKNGKGLSPRYR
jgi:hypothetical protein